MSATRAGNIFTTHTPVDAGLDRFSRELMYRHLHHYVEQQLHLDFAEFMALGRNNPKDDSEPFNMAYLAMRGSGFVNGVSRMHGKMSRRMFLPFYHRWPEAEVPIGHITNGVHAATWASAEASALWQKASPRKNANKTLSESLSAETLDAVTDQRLWRLRNKQRAKLLTYAHNRLVAQRAVSGWGADNQDPVRKLDPHVLTLAFAHRFAEYKRPTLLLHDPDRFARILRDEDRPVQLIVAGKAHPADQNGQSMIRAWNQFIQTHRLQERVVFLADYDMSLTQKLVQGADVWINTPRPPWEASGTSGMKVLVNGGLNLSVLDGWWSEAYKPEFGWAVKSADVSEPDALDADRIYSLLEDEIKPLFYERNSDGISNGWVAKMRASMNHLTLKFSAHRTVTEYLERYYKPAAAAYVRRSQNGARLAREITDFAAKIKRFWSDVKVLSWEAELQEGGPHYRMTSRVQLGELCPCEVTVEAYADDNGSGAVRVPLVVQGASPDNSSADDGPKRYVFRGEIPGHRPVWHYTVRIYPHHPEVRVPLELQEIFWEK